MKPFTGPLPIRSSGVLLHPTSLPGPYGVGDVGPTAHRWIRTLARAKQTWWQFLPLGPPADANSPYKCFSAFAGNPLLISPELLAKEGLLSRQSLRVPRFAPGKVDFPRVVPWKQRLLSAAYRKFSQKRRRSLVSEYDDFRVAERKWLDDFALFMALKEKFANAAWTQWPDELAARRRQALREARQELSDQVERHCFIQFLFFRQWKQLRDTARDAGVKLIGDIPIFVALDSSDVWSNADQFLLDERRQPKVVAGVPPDFFSRTGQLWGNPVYDWPAMKKNGYAWWIDRFGAMAAQADVIRLDHFRGFCGFYAVPAHHKDARKGEWKPGPGMDLFKAAERKLGSLSFIAEDLGEITPDVCALRDAMDLPGMKILQFGLGEGPSSMFLPHHYDRNFVAYTATHDNDTSRGWYESLDRRQAAFARHYASCDEKNMVREMLRLCWSSTAVCAIAPLQDVLDLPSQARMNLPGSREGNWSWRALDRQVHEDRLSLLAELTETYDRSGHHAIQKGRP